MPAIVEEPEAVSALEVVEVGTCVGVDVTGKWGGSLSSDSQIVMMTRAIASKTNFNGLNFMAL